MTLIEWRRGVHHAPLTRSAPKFCKFPKIPFPGSLLQYVRNGAGRSIQGSTAMDIEGRESGEDGSGCCPGVYKRSRRRRCVRSVRGYLHSDDVVRRNDTLASVRLACLPPERAYERQSLNEKRERETKDGLTTFHCCRRYRGSLPLRTRSRWGHQAMRCLIPNKRNGSVPVSQLFLDRRTGRT